MLKSLEVFGFKSFADRTKFEFASGITGVVGPNGSGKSNVVDSIKWILGDQSPKSLRGKEMSDVIFNGAAGRKPSSFAEATLTFDNTHGLLPIDSQEVQIGRRLWQNGDSEYLINRNPARLKDIRDLFMGTGAATSAYSIIEQGRVDQILQANPTTRRQVFEEAAGISRYKARKVDAQRKLERVGQNLLRLTDIVDEVETQLNSLRSQAAKASKYRDFSTELKQLWVGLAGDDARYLSSQLAEIEQEIAGYEAKLESLGTEIQQATDRIASLDTGIAEVENHMYGVERSSSANRETLARVQATINHQTAHRREVEADIVRLRNQQIQMSRRVQQIVAELEETREKQESFSGEFTELKQKIHDREQLLHEQNQKLEEHQQQIEDNRERVLELTRHASAVSNRASTIASQDEELQARLQFSRERLAQLDSQVSVCSTETERRRTLVEQSVGELKELDGQLRELGARLEALIEEQNQSRSSLAELRERRSAADARLNVLEDLERRQEGLEIGVKEILQRAKTSKHAPWTHILGNVADLLEVELENAAFLDVALGSRSKLIVLDEYQSFVEYITQGRAQFAGQVGFLALDTAEEKTSAPTGAAFASPIDGELIPDEEPAGGDRFHHFRLDLAKLPDLHDQRGVLQRADELAQSSPICPDLASRLLADTWIVESFDDAMALSAGKGRGCRFVTMQGERLEADGTFYVGKVRSEAAIVSRKSELRQLKNEILRLDRKIDDEVRQLTGLGDSLRGFNAEKEALSRQLQEANDLHAQRKADFGRQNEELQRLQNERQTVADEIEQLQSRVSQLKQEAQTAQMDAAQAEEDLASLKLQIEQADREQARIEHRVATLKEKLQDENLYLAKQEERLTAWKQTVARLEEDYQQREQQFQEAIRRHDAAEQKRRQLNLQILNAQADLAELYLTKEALAEQVAGHLAEKERLRGQRGSLAGEEDRIRKQRREINELKHDQEIKRRDIRHQMTTLAERLEEEYQLVLEDVVAAGTSAYLIWQQEQTLDDADDDVEAEIDDEPSEEEEEEEEDDDEEEEVTDEEVEAEDETDPEAEIAPEDDDAESLEEFDDDEIEDVGEEEPIEELQFDVERFLEVRGEIEAQVNRLRKKIKLMGSVNSNSLHDLDELETRYHHLKTQHTDLVEAKASLEEIVRKINLESKRLFFESLETIREHFRELFRKLFGGGEADIVLEDPDDVLECGIDIVARPPGKELRSITLLSGGEKTLTAVAMLMAIFRSRPSPFCILDEVDAALDEANVDRFVGLVKDFEKTTQFIMITHNKRSMIAASVLYGVTMEQSGVSKRMSVRFEDVSENGEFNASSSAA